MARTFPINSNHVCLTKQNKNLFNVWGKEFIKALELRSPPLAGSISAKMLDPTERIALWSMLMGMCPSYKGSSFAFT